jgi:hypothetical protein
VRRPACNHAIKDHRPSSATSTNHNHYAIITLRCIGDATWRGGGINHHHHHHHNNNSHHNALYHAMLYRCDANMAWWVSIITIIITIRKQPSLCYIMPWCIGDANMAAVSIYYHHHQSPSSQ